MTDLERLQHLIAARHPCIAVGTVEEEYVLGLLGLVCVEERREMLRWTVTRGVHDGLVAGQPPVLETEHPAGALAFVSDRAPANAVVVMLDLAAHLKDERTLRACREAVDALAARGGQLVLIDPAAELPPSITAVATRFTVSLPEEEELDQLLRDTLQEAHRQQSIIIELTRSDLQAVIRNLRGLTRRQAKRVILDAVADDRRFDRNDLPRIIAAKRRAIGDGVLEFVEAPVDLAEIGGVSALKGWLDRRAGCFGDDAVKFGLRPPRGVLMLGVQGAGKSLAAKAVATAWQRPLLRLDAGALYDSYIGESERRLRDALRQAERMAPVVLWIDEIEKGFASAASHSSDGGLSKRMFGTLLTWMQEHVAPVFLIATANDIEALPPELLRKGRFDEIFFVDLPSIEGRHQIFAIHLKKRGRNPKQFDLDALAEASAGFSGAEIEQAVVSALHDAFAAKEDVTTDHVLAALRTSPPLSVTMAEKIAALRQWAAGRCVPAE